MCEGTQKRDPTHPGQKWLPAGNSHVPKGKRKLTRLGMAGVIEAEGPTGTKVVEKGIRASENTRTWL